MPFPQLTPYQETPFSFTHPPTNATTSASLQTSPTNPYTTKLTPSYTMKPVSTSSYFSKPIPQSSISNSTYLHEPPITTPSSHPSDPPSTASFSPTRRAARQIVVASFNNESDALSILAHAATDDEDRTERERRAAAGMGRDDLGEFALIKRGLLDEAQLQELVRGFFEHYHPALVSGRLTFRVEKTRLSRGTYTFSSPLSRSPPPPSRSSALLSWQE